MKTYTDVLSVGDPDVRDSSDVHRPRSGDVANISETETGGPRRGFKETKSGTYERSDAV